MKRKHLALLLALLLTLGTAGTIFVAATGSVAAQESTPTPDGADGDQNVTVSEGSYSLDELRQGGTSFAGSSSGEGEGQNAAPPSGRLIENGASPVFVRHYPPGPASEEFEYLEPGQTVKSRDISLLSVRFGENVEPKTYTLVVVYWQAENGSAVNQTVVQHQLEFGRYYDLSDITLRPEFDETWQVTMWLEQDGEPVDGARWRFEYRPVPSSQGLPFANTWGAFVPWFIWNFLVTTGVGSVIVIAGGMVATRKAGPAPALKLGGLIGFVMLLLYVSAFGNTLSLITAAPYLLAIPIVVLVLIVTLHFSSETFQIRAEKPYVTSARDPLGGTVPSIETEEADVYHAIRFENGDRGIIDPFRLRSWFARWFADVGRIRSSQWSTLVHTEGDAPEAEKIYVDQDSEVLIDFTPAHWRVQMLLWDYLDRIVETIRGSIQRANPWAESPNNSEFVYPEGFQPLERDRPSTGRFGPPTLFAAAVVGAGAFVVGLFTSPDPTVSAQMAAASFVLMVAFVRVDAYAGRASVRAAPAHATAAKAARVVEEQEREKWETFDDLSERIAELEFEGLEKVIPVLESYREKSQERLDSLFGDASNGEDSRNRRQLAEGKSDD
jgi:hypothetical protein